jgi:hypothetical protein
MFKSLITASAVLVMAAPAFASKARLASMQNAAHVIDSQSIFDNPAKSYLLGDFATLEMGATSTSVTGANTPENVITNGSTAAALYGPDAEGGFVKSYGDNKIGFYVGRKSAFTTRMRSLTGFAGQINPIEIMYGFQAADLKWGVSFNYSKAEPKTAAAGAQKEDAMGLRAGVIGTNWDAGLTLGLGSNATGNDAATIITGVNLNADSASTYKGTTGFKVNGGYWFDTMYVYGNYYQDGAKLEGVKPAALGGVAANATIEQSQYEIGVIDTMKADGMNFFYGVSYIGFTSKAKEITPTALETTIQGAFSQEQTQLPFIMGVEADAASWLTLRASLKQNVILGSTKPNTGDTSTGIANNTTVALGAGMKFNKFTLDSTLAAGSVPGTVGTGAINANNMMANASLTYLF